MIFPLYIPFSTLSILISFSWNPWNSYKKIRKFTHQFSWAERMNSEPGWATAFRKSPPGKSGGELSLPSDFNPLLDTIFCQILNQSLSRQLFRQKWRNNCKNIQVQIFSAWAWLHEFKNIFDFSDRSRLEVKLQLFSQHVEPEAYRNKSLIF